MTADEDLADKPAKYLVGQARGRRWHYFSVLEERGQPVPFPYHWRDMNRMGVTFHPNRMDAAAWVIQALLAGYIVSYHAGARNGFVAGRSLKDGLPGDG